MTDLALNTRQVLFDKDTANQNYFAPPNFINQRAVRDSIYLRTKYPDLKPPVLDLNDIQIKATPTNPTSPNGETLFEMWLWVKDESDFVGKASGFAHGYYVLRDPQGLETHVSMQRDLGNTFYDIKPDSSIYGYKRYYFKTLLPVGSPPGLWGVSAIGLIDHARNRKYYSFVEYVRFDVEQSKVLQVTPFVEILGKKVNSKNVDSVAVKIGCKSCIDQNYRIRMYSSMGGSSVVSEGKMTKDTITVSNLKLKGVNDGVLYATVFMLDSTRALIGTGKATYTKDATLPTNYNLTPNRSLLGRSNLDSFIVAIKSVEINSSNQVVLKQISINPGSTGQIGDSVVINSIRDIYTANLPVVNSTAQHGTGNQFNLESEGGMPSALMNTGFYDSTLRIPKSVFDKLADGTIEIKLISTDSLGNNGLSVSQFIYKDTKAPVLIIVNDSLVGLKKYVKLVSDEFISNTPTVSDFVVSNGVINSVSKLNSKSFGLLITKNCNNALTIQLNGSVLKDSVGNINTVFNTTLSDVVIPSTPVVSASGSTSICAGNSVTLSSNSGFGNQWYKDGQLINNATLANYTSNSSGSYTVVSTNANGCVSAASNAIQITVNPIPSTPVTTASSVCEGGAVSALTATASTGNSLRWYGTSATGGTASTSAPTASSSTAGVTNYYVSQVSAQGCESERSVLKHTVNPLPAKPVISWSGVQFSTTATGVNYQWLLNGALVSGATASTHKPLNTGDFRLRVTDPNGCVNVSDSFKLVVTALANLVTTPSSNIATVYPNPASNKVVLEFATLPAINLNFQLVSPSGKVLSSTVGRNKVNVIDVSDVQSGNYFIRVIGKKYDQVKKVLIQK